jgi:hypothetical protein
MLYTLHFVFGLRVDSSPASVEVARTSVAKGVSSSENASPLLSSARSCDAGSVVVDKSSELAMDVGQGTTYPVLLAQHP